MGEPLFGVSVACTLTDLSSAGEARRKALALSTGLGASEELAGRIALVTTELAGNVVRHGGGGEVILRSLPGTGVEVLALDRGPGMADLERCLRDGHSTGGTAGYGLGMVPRLATEWDAFTAPGKGTVVLARFWERKAPARPRFLYGVVCRPKPGEDVCGDGWAAVEHAGTLQIAVADGLGHGPEAAKAARAALEVFSSAGPRTASSAALIDVLERAHGALRAFRGAAMTLATIDPGHHLVHVLGAGNVAGSIIPRDGPARGVMVQNGTLGAAHRRSQPYQYPWTHSALLLLHSDGLQTHWKLDPYPGLVQRDPSVIAAVLYRDFKRGTDDVTVFAVREEDRWTSAS